MKKIRVLTFQFKPIYLNPEANLKKFNRLIKKHSYFNPDLVIFPEYALTGPLYGHYQMAFLSDSKIFKELCSIAQKHSIFLIPGSFVREKQSNRYNSTCLINPQGKILGFYDKQNLWSSEKRYLDTGNQTKVFDASIGKITIQICADLQSSKISNDYRLLKPDLIINLAMWSWEDTKSSAKKVVPKNIQFLQTEQLIKARAIENRAYAIFCNYAHLLTIKAKRKYTETSIGNTMVVNPYGEIIAKVNNSRAQVLATEIDISKTHWSKYHY
jgi:predicted amidohydrolase